MKSLKKILQVVPQVRFIVFKRDAINARCLASIQSAERKPQQLIIEQREQVIENRVRLRDRSLVDVIQPPASALKKTVHRDSVSEYGRCSVWIMYWPGREPRLAKTAFPAPILLGFIPSGWRPDFNGTMRPSDSLNVICRPC
jgi:hypothetical protein